MEKSYVEIIKQVAELMATGKEMAKKADANVTKVTESVRTSEIKQSENYEGLKQEHNGIVERYNETHSAMNKMIEQMQEFIEQMKSLSPETLVIDSEKCVENFEQEIARVRAMNENQPGNK